MLLSIIVGMKLNFTKYISKIFEKATQKLHTLAWVSGYIFRKKNKTSHECFLSLQFGYCPFVWMFHSWSLNNQISNLQERAFDLVYKDTTFSFNKLLQPLS